MTKWPDKRLFGIKNPASGQYEWITRTQVAERVNNLRGALAKLGLNKGDKVGVIVSNCVEWYICEQAAHGLGAVFVPMYEKELKKIWQYIVADAAVKYLFVRDSNIYEQVKDFKNEIPTLKDIFIHLRRRREFPEGPGRNGQEKSRAVHQASLVGSCLYHLYLRHHR